MPASGGVVLSFMRMDRILEIDTANLVAVVEPGVITFVLQQEVAKKGLSNPPDPLRINIRASAAMWPECAGGPTRSNTA